MNIWIEDYKRLFLITGIASLICCAGCLFMVESPYYLYEKGDFVKMKQVLFRILRINMSRDSPEYWNTKQRVESTCDGLCKEGLVRVSDGTANTLLVTDTHVLNKSLIWFRIGLYVIIVCNLCFLDTLLSLIPQQMGIDNPYLNGAFLGACDIAGYLILTLIAHRTKRRLLNAATCFICLSVSILCLAVDLSGERATLPGMILQTMFSLILKLAVSMNFVLVFNYGAEMFNVGYKGLAIGLSIFIGRLFASLCALDVDIAEKYTILCHSFRISHIAMLLRKL